MKYGITDNKRGAVLLLTFIMMVTLAVVTAAFLYTVSVRIKGASVDMAGDKAFWLAEAGIQDVIYRLSNDAAYRQSPDPIDELLGSGNYQVNVDVQGSKYTAVSTGTSGIVSRTVTQSMTLDTKGSNVTITLEKDWDESVPSS